MSEATSPDVLGSQPPKRTFSPAAGLASGGGGGGVAGVPGGGRGAHGEERTVTHPVRRGSGKDPRNAAPACSSTTSPDGAAFSAPCTSPPAGTVRMRPVGGITVVSRYTRGSSGRVAARTTAGAGVDTVAPALTRIHPGRTPPRIPDAPTQNNALAPAPEAC